MNFILTHRILGKIIFDVFEDNGAILIKSDELLMKLQDNDSNKKKPVIIDGIKYLTLNNVLSAISYYDDSAAFMSFCELMQMGLSSEYNVLFCKELPALNQHLNGILKEKKKDRPMKEIIKKMKINAKPNGEFASVNNKDDLALVEDCKPDGELNRVSIFRKYLVDNGYQTLVELPNHTNAYPPTCKGVDTGLFEVVFYAMGNSYYFFCFTTKLTPKGVEYFENNKSSE